MKYEIYIIDGKTLELKYRDNRSETRSLHIPLEEAIPMIFHAATVLCRQHFDSVNGYPDFHGLLKELKRRGTITISN